MPRNGLCSSCDKPKCPFLTVVTRCYKRPDALRENVRSLKTQTDPDYEQIFIVDPKGYGLAAADKALGKYKDINCGEYVMVLDDDDKVIDIQFIEKLKSIVNEDSPDIVIWKGAFSKDHKVQLPRTDPLWGKRPVKCAIGSFNYCVSNELYTKYINVCQSGETGDFDFINRVYHSKEKPKAKWVGNLFVACQFKGVGKTEEAINHNIITNGKKPQRVYRNKFL